MPGRQFDAPGREKMIERLLQWRRLGVHGRHHLCGGFRSRDRQKAGKLLLKHLDPRAEAPCHNHLAIGAHGFVNGGQ